MATVTTVFFTDPKRRPNLDDSQSSPIRTYADVLTDQVRVLRPPIRSWLQ
jgi:hypothetical protein